MPQGNQSRVVDWMFVLLLLVIEFGFIKSCDRFFYINRWKCDQAEPGTAWSLMISPGVTLWPSITFNSFNWLRVSLIVWRLRLYGVVVSVTAAGWFAWVCLMVALTRVIALIPTITYPKSFTTDQFPYIAVTNIIILRSFLAYELGAMKWSEFWAITIEEQLLRLSCSVPDFKLQVLEG